MFAHLLPDSDPPPGNRSLQYSQPQLLMQVFEGVISRPGQTSSSRLELTSAEKKKRVVLKRVNLDKSGIRSNFLATGTQARVRGCLHLPPAEGALPPSRAVQGLLFKGQRNPALCLCLCAAEEVDDPFQKSTNHASMTAANKESPLCDGQAATIDGSHSRDQKVVCIQGSLASVIRFCHLGCEPNPPAHCVGSMVQGLVLQGSGTAASRYKGVEGPLRFSLHP